MEVNKDLEAMGISKQEIVVGFHYPSMGESMGESMREYSDYATS